MKRQSAIAILFVCGMMACESDQDKVGYVIDAGPSSGRGGMVLDIDASGPPEIGKTLRISVTYWSVYDWVPDTLVVQAAVRTLEPSFELVSGDSAWVDTLFARVPRTRSFTIRPKQDGERLLCMSVGASIDTTYAIGASDCITIVTPWSRLPHTTSTHGP